MTISLEQQVDLLWKKVAYDVSKTDISAVKGATNESIPSPPFIPGDMIWNDSHLIPNVIPPSSTTIVGINIVNCTMDTTATQYVTWKTNLTDWIPTPYGSTYQIKVFAAPIGTTAANLFSVGTQLYAAGSGHDDEWYFDYQSGVLNFIGNNLPYGINFSTSSIWVNGATYNGGKGLSVISNLSLGDFSISSNVIASTSDIVLQANGNINSSGSQITNVGYPTTPNSAVTLSYLNSTIAGISGNAITQGNTSISVNGNVGVVTMFGSNVAVFSNSGATFGNLTISGNVLSSANDIILTPSTVNIVDINSTTALGLPVGTSTQRPVSASVGYLRYNSSISQVEVFDGTQWVSLQAQLSYQVFNGDGTNVTYSLMQSTSAYSIIVSINGVIQSPNVAYTVSGANITFSSVPLTTDQIDVRYLTTSVGPATDLPYQIYINPNPVIVGTTSTTIDSFTTTSVATAKYMITAETTDGNVHSTELLLIQNGITAVYTAFAVLSTSSFPLTFSATIANNICSLSSVSSLPSTTVKFQAFYTVK